MNRFTVGHVIQSKFCAVIHGCVERTKERKWIQTPEIKGQRSFSTPGHLATKV